MIKDMKEKTLFIILASMIVGLQGCWSAKMERSKDLIVVEQSDTVCGIGEENGYEWAAFTVEAPVNGPQALVDSVMAFLNNELLYDFLLLLFT